MFRHGALFGQRFLLGPAKFDEGGERSFDLDRCEALVGSNERSRRAAQPIIILNTLISWNNAFSDRVPACWAMPGSRIAW